MTKTCSVSFNHDAQRSGSRTAIASNVELFVMIISGWKPLTIITKSSTLDAGCGYCSSPRFASDADLTKKEFKRWSLSRDLWNRITLSIAQPIWVQKLKNQAVNYLKWLNQFAVSMEAYSHAKKNQHHSSIQSRHIAYLILGITFDMPWCTWTQSYECTYVCRTTYKKN